MVWNFSWIFLCFIKEWRDNWRVSLIVMMNVYLQQQLHLVDPKWAGSLVRSSSYSNYYWLPSLFTFYILFFGCILFFSPIWGTRKNVWWVVCCISILFTSIDWGGFLTCLWLFFCFLSVVPSIYFNPFMYLLCRWIYDESKGLFRDISC